MVSVVWTLVLWLVSLGLGTLGVFYLYVRSVYRYFEGRGIPYDKPTFPFGSFTAAVFLRRSITLTLADIYARHRDHKLVGFFSLWTKQVLIKDPEVLKTILIKDFETFENRGIYHNKEKDPLFGNLFFLEGDSWKFLRTKLTPTFATGKIKGMHSIIEDCSNLLLKYVEKQQTTTKAIDCQSMFGKFALTVVASTAFGIECDSLTADHSKLSELTKQMNAPTMDRFYMAILIFNCTIAKFLNISLVPEVVSQFFNGLVKNTIQFREVNRIIRNDYLQQLIDLRKSENEDALGLAEEDLAAHVFVFLSAGNETLSSPMSFCLYELMRQPEIQARLHRELDTLPDLSYDSVNGCQYLDMVVSETLRKYPPQGFLNRECSQAYQVPGTDVVLEKGTQVLVSVHGMHNDPELFPDPELFNPERFSKENKEDVKPYTYMPFGDGPRFCIGKRFALMVVKTGLASILRRFKVLSSPATPSPLQIEPLTITTFAANGMWLVFEKRSKD